MTLHVKVGGIWKQIAYGDAQIKVAGAWKVLNQVYVKVGGTWRPVLIEPVPPDPVSVTTQTQNAGRVHCTVNVASNVYADYSKLEFQFNIAGAGYGSSVFVDIGAAYSGTAQYTDLQTSVAHGASVVARCRTVSISSQTSAWVTAGSVNAVNANPSAPTLSSVSLVSGGYFTVTWTDSANVYDDPTSTVSVKIYIRQVGSGWGTPYATVTWTGGSGRTQQVAQPAYDTQYEFKVETTNVKGSVASATVSQWSPPQAGTTLYFIAQDWRTWKTAAPADWRVAQSTLYVGYADSGNDKQYSWIGYANTVYDRLHGYTPSNVRVILKRNDSYGYAEAIYVYCNSQGTLPAGDPRNNSVGSATQTSTWVGSDSEHYCDLDATERSAWASGSVKGLTLTARDDRRDSTYYMQFQMPQTQYVGYLVVDF